MKPRIDFWTVLLIAALSFCMTSVGQVELPGSSADSRSGPRKLRKNSSQNRIRLKTTVTDALLEKFQQGQAISITVPPGNEQSISSLVVRKPECFKPEAVSVRPRTRADGDVIVVELSRQLFDRLDYQPIRIRIYESNVERIDLVPAAGIMEPEDEAPPNIMNPEFYLRLKPANGVAVAFENNHSFRLTNDVFDHEIPFEEIDAIFFNSGEEETASVVLRNGDNVSGKHNWPDSVEFETLWGEELIKLDRVVSITRSRSVKLVPSGDKSPRWVLEELKQN